MSGSLTAQHFADAQDEVLRFTEQQQANNLEPDDHAFTSVDDSTLQYHPDFHTFGKVNLYIYWSSLFWTFSRFQHHRMSNIHTACETIIALSPGSSYDPVLLQKVAAHIRTLLAHSEGDISSMVKPKPKPAPQRKPATQPQPAPASRPARMLDSFSRAEWSNQECGELFTQALQEYCRTSSSDYQQCSKFPGRRH